MGTYKKLEDWKLELVGKQFTFLTVTDIIQNYTKSGKKAGYLAVCTCRCGNSKNVNTSELLKGHVKSCGCYEKSVENSERHRRINESNHDKMSEQRKRWCEANPEKLKEIGKKRSQWCKEHPEECKEASDKYKAWCKANPDALKARGELYRAWCEANPDKVKEIGKKRSQWCKEHPEEMRRIGAEHSKLYKSNPWLGISAGKKVSKWCKNNPKLVLASRHKVHKIMSEKLRLKRTGYNHSLLLSILHPSQHEALLRGDLTSESMIQTRCPTCGEFSEHRLHNIVVFCRNEFRTGMAPQCPCCVSKGRSLCESLVSNTISEFTNEVPCVNTRSVISPLELDLYYPSKRIAIEFNGAYWHSDNLKNFDYHFNKFKLCRDLGIRLISIFDTDFIYNRDRVNSILREAFSDIIAIYSRKCEVRRVGYSEKRGFINQYHFDGDSNQGTIAYGLYYNNELISCMTFGNLRGQNSKHLTSNHYELVRFVTKSGFRVVGGASRLFKHFINDYNPEYILCYSDNDFFSGDTYKHLGFRLKSLGEDSIDYQWVNNKGYLNRWECMPNKLLDKFPKYRTIKIEGSKENYIMRDLGYLKVYRCGNSKWEWFNIK